MCAFAHKAPRNHAARSPVRAILTIVVALEFNIVECSSSRREDLNQVTARVVWQCVAQSHLCGNVIFFPSELVYTVQVVFFYCDPIKDDLKHLEAKGRRSFFSHYVMCDQLKFVLLVQSLSKYVVVRLCTCWVFLLCTCTCRTILLCACRSILVCTCALVGS